MKKFTESEPRVLLAECGLSILGGLSLVLWVIDIAEKFIQYLN